MLAISPISLLPADWRDAVLVGRVWRAGRIDGPCVVAARAAAVSAASRLP